MRFTMVEEIAQSHLVTYGMDSFNFVGDMVTLTLCKVGYVSFVVMS